jgi:glycosyltransferase involved in cell wall biosynthesis
MIREPLVSVIIPVYKGNPEYIRTCLDSLCDQLYRNWEAIIIVDDYENDATSTKIIEQYSRSDIRIFGVWRPTKTNPATARNWGLCFASGKYITFLDSDDWWQLDKLSRQVKYMELHPDLMWTCHWLALDYSNGDVVVNKSYPGKSWGIEGLHTVLMKHELLDKVGKFDESLNKADDADMVLRIQNYSSRQLPLSLSHCRINPSGLTMNTTKFENLISVTKLAIKNQAWWLLPYHWKNYILSSMGCHFD